MYYSVNNKDEENVVRKGEEVRMRTMEEIIRMKKM